MRGGTFLRRPDWVQSGRRRMGRSAEGNSAAVNRPLNGGLWLSNLGLGFLALAEFHENAPVRSRQFR